MPARIEVEGWQRVVRGFNEIAIEVKRDNIRQLKEALEPVREKAEHLASADIRNLGSGRWSKQRLGVTVRSVYLAPKARNAGGPRRPNLAGLLLHRAMEPAVEEDEAKIRVHLEEWLAVVHRAAGF